MKMKKWYIGIMLALFVGTCSLSALAYRGPGPGPRPGHGPGPGPGPGPAFHERQAREDARFVIHRTALVLDDAQTAARRHRRYNGLGMAVAHQRRAQDLYRQGLYRDAIFHSLRARNIAFEVIQNNRERIRPEFRRDTLEDRYYHDSPRDNDLDLNMGMIKIDRDDAVISLHLNFDL